MVEQLILAIGGIACGAAFIFAYFAPAAWAIADARKRGASMGTVLFLFWLFGPFSALFWLLTRPAQTLLERSPASYTTAEDALAAAARLDHGGEWDAAANLYRSIAERWPDQREYVSHCLYQIEAKRELS